MREHVSILFCFVCTLACYGRTITVDNDGSADFNTIQAAVDDANDGDVVIVQLGRYTGYGNRDINFLGKAITVRSVDPNDPNIVEATIIDCNASETDWHRGFVFDSNEGPDSVLDGLTVINGQMSTTPTTPLIREETSGGAIACFSSSPTICNCIIKNNSALTGGGIFLTDDVFLKDNSTSIIKCIFIHNNASSGCALYCDCSSLILRYCTFVGNSSTISGGALSLYGSDVTIDISEFTANIAENQGGALAVTSSVYLKNCLLAGNLAYGGGSAIACGAGPITVKNCTILGSIYLIGSAVPQGGSSRLFPDMSVINSIIWGSPNQKCFSYNTPPNFSCIENLDAQTVGTGNIEVDPCFASLGYWDPNGTPEDANDDFWIDGDYHLNSQAGRWDQNSQSWVRDDVTSPCIDAGDPMAPIGHESFPNGGVINMGAYAGTAQASKSWFDKPVCETIVAGDINGDCVVDFKDFVILARHWLQER
jgi:hypothetical protein